MHVLDERHRRLAVQQVSLRSVIRGAGSGGGAPRAKAVSVTVPLTTGLLTTVSAYGLLAPVAFAKTGGSANLAIGAATGNISATAALAAGASQSLSGTATGADGCVLPFTATLTGAVATPTPPASGDLTAPVQDWRAVTTAVTDLVGTADAAMQAQQAVKAAKARGASFATGVSSSAGRIFKVGPHTQPLWLAWWGLGQNGSSAVDVSTDAGATWTSAGFANQTIQGGTVADRTQIASIPAGAAKWIRLTCASSSSSYTVWPILFERPATGLAPVVLVWGNSIPHYHLAGDTGGSPATAPGAFMDACMAAYGGDPVVILASEPSAQIGGLQNHLTGVLATWGAFASTAYLCGLIGGDATALHPYQASQKAALDTAIDTFVGQVKAAGLQVIMDDLSFMFQALDELPQASLADQSPGRGPYNVNVVWGAISRHAAGSFDTDLQVGKSGMHFWSLYNAADLTDLKHPTKNRFTAWQGFHASGWYRFLQTGVWPSHQVHQRAATAEATLLQAEYDALGYALQLLPATTAKTALVNRRTVLLPLVLLKTANLAVVTYEASALPADKTAAQNAVAAAVAGGSSAADVASAYGVAVNLSGTTACTTRINAVGGITVTKRAKAYFGTASGSAPASFQNINTGSTFPVALITDVGSASGWTFNQAAAYTQGTSGSAVAVGAAPNDFPAATMGRYFNRSAAGGMSFTFSGLDPNKKYRIFIAVGLSSSTDRTETWSIQGNGAAVTSGAKNPASSNSVIFSPDDGLKDIVPTGGGQITISCLQAGGNASATYINAFSLEEYTGG